MFNHFTHTRVLISIAVIIFLSLLNPLSLISDTNIHTITQRRAHDYEIIQVDPFALSFANVILYTWSIRWICYQCLITHKTVQRYSAVTWICIPVLWFGCVCRMVGTVCLVLKKRKFQHQKQKTIRNHEKFVRIISLFGVFASLNSTQHKNHQTVNSTMSARLLIIITTNKNITKNEYEPNRRFKCLMLNNYFFVLLLSRVPYIVYIYLFIHFRILYVY